MRVCRTTTTSTNPNSKVILLSTKTYLGGCATVIEATARLREASACRAEFEGKMKRVRRVRFDMRPQVCGWTLGTFTVPWEDNPEGG